MLFYIGSHTGGQLTNNYTIPPPGARVIQLDINPAEIGRNYRPDPWDSRATYAIRCKKFWQARPPRRRELPGSSMCKRGYARGGIVWTEHYRSEALPMRPERLCKELSEHLPADAILVSDTGHSGIWTGTMLDLRHPGQSYIRCSGSLGWGLPAAMGAKCAAPDRPGALLHRRRRHLVSHRRA